MATWEWMWREKIPRETRVMGHLQKLSQRSAVRSPWSFRLDTMPVDTVTCLYMV